MRRMEKWVQQNNMATEDDGELPNVPYFVSRFTDRECNTEFKDLVSKVYIF